MELTLSNSSSSFSLLPPYPHIFHGRESELYDVVKILVQDSAHVAILGAGGMGKTNLATAALHDPQVEAKYSHRYFVPCQSSSTCTHLVAAIADCIGVEKGPNLSKAIAHYLAHSPASLLVLDNLETAWEPLSSRPEVEEFLSLLTNASQLGLMITLRGAERPSKVKWTRPFLAPLDPLSISAALQTFIDVADDSHNESKVQQLLDLTGNLPLAVSLIAGVASHEGCDAALSRWKSENTHMLSEGYDQRSNLDISIMLSFTSSRMTSGAQELLSIMSILPDGLTDADLVQVKLPIPDILTCKTTLIRTSLAFIGQDQRLKVLVPIREHVLNIHPPSNRSKLRLRKYFHDILELWNKFRNLNVADIVPEISRNLGNFNSVLQDALSIKGSDVIQNFQSILFLNHLYRRQQDTYSPLLLLLETEISHWKEAPIFGDYLIQLVESASYIPDLDMQNHITLGNLYFQLKPPLEQGRT
ncbi:P-loop containing nucleoside triphosphate hydrolase protein [Mycena rebaudengoi]|nr:P-loop containing nucleoside triphosphate hydrolase protein [Mycena rebaudengoi]